MNFNNEKGSNLLPLAILLGMLPGFANAFTSGSTGTVPFNPTVDQSLQVPPSGVLEFTTVNIPAGVTVRFIKNATNTPVTILASGNVTIAGAIDISGTGSANVGASGDGNIGDDGQPGLGGPGGYDGGRGGVPSKAMGGTGLGPGGGGGGKVGAYNTNNDTIGGGGGGFGVAGTSSYSTAGVGGGVYGSSQLLPLIGGSGGGGGTGGAAFNGSGGGGGGGAILIASSGTVSITGSVSANGGASGAGSGDGHGGSGGGGSGGAIRIVATTISGNGSLTATGGAAGTAYSYNSGSAYYSVTGGAGAVGRIRLEAETFTRTAASNPAHSFAAPGSVFLTGLPSLTITSVAGINAPPSPTGNADITLPATTPNPVAVVFTTTGVPIGNTVTLTVVPATGTPIIVPSGALDGTTASATASVNVNLPSGPSVLQATTTYTIVVAMGDALSVYAQGERVEKIRLSATLNGKSTTTLITVSGKEYLLPDNVPAAALAAS